MRHVDGANKFNHKEGPISQGAVLFDYDFS